MEKGNTKDDGKGKYRKKPYTPQTIIHSVNSKRLLEKFKKQKELCERILEDEKDKESPSFERTKRTLDVCSILLDIGSKGANLELIHQILPEPLTIDNPEKENPHVLKHIYLFDDYERLLLSPEWPTVLKKHHERREEFTKKERALRSAAGRLFSYLKPLDDNLYYSDQTMSMYARDLNREIRIKKEQIASLIQMYLKFIAVELSISSYQSFDKKEYLKMDLKMSKDMRNIRKIKIVVLVNELKRIGYSNKMAYSITANLLHLTYPHIFRDPDPELIRQQYTSYLPKTRTKTK